MDFRRRSLRIWGAAALLALTTSVMSAAQLAYSRQRHLDSGRELALALSNAAAQRVLASMQLLDRLLQEAVSRIPSQGPVPPGILEPLRPKLATANEIQALSFIDGDGILRQVVRRQAEIPPQILSVDVSDRLHYQFQRRHWSEDRMAVSPPAIDYLTESMAWFASRPVISPDGRFLGMAGMAIDPELLAAPLRAGTPGDGDAAGIFSTEGVLFARHPYVPQSIGRPITGSSVFQAYSELGESGSVAEIVSTADEKTRTVGFTQVPGYSLVVNVGISHERLLRQWWREAQIHGGIQLALTLGIFLLAWGMVRAERKHLSASEKLRATEREHIDTLSREVESQTAQLQHSLAALQESEERFRLIADISPLPLVVTRRSDSVVVYINTQAAEAFQVPQADAKGKIAPNFWENPLDRTRMVEALAKDGCIRNMETVLKRADGQRFTALLSAAFGHLQGEAMVLVSVMDISERKYLEQELARSNAEHQRFSYAISHDLQEPLRMVASYLALVDRRYGEKLDQEGRDFIGFAVDGAKRMSRMISDLLEYSRVRRQTWDFQTSDLNAVAADARANLVASIQDSQAQIDIGPMPTVAADSGQIMRVLQNLMGNALKYRSPDRPPQVTVSATRDGGFWNICIVDNGRGFDPSESERLFQIFQRLHPNSGIDGSGVGLALCRSIITAHGGAIWGRSDGPDQGATFCFSLPVERQSQKGAE
ncbi:ATP-binding protein [Magnetospirillum sulfuroxidans]|uniref:histidine kinase n=1 Tax=Magnetospirillum sulfuroxidans TaxID=611300 RepID=A0ABS5ICR9_9PROT|nr:ATP-binding protein [Magnetospirillum sulfuroxidans]MBR9972124.1 PAS domain S-box protein [Magnetospirillum sulfuroxidans]